MYAQLVPSGCLVFDVGAHRGEYAEMFLELGCRVVAFEPQPLLAKTIRRHYPRVIVEQCAVGAAVGSVALRVGHDTQHSSAAAQRIAADPARFSGAFTTPVLTLGWAAEQYGVPGFVKIDAEGYEQQVLAGMSFAPAALCFEYLRADSEGALACVRRLGELGRYEFAVEAAPWELGDWTPMIDSARLTRESGDVFARLREDSGLPAVEAVSSARLALV